MNSKSQPNQEPQRLLLIGGCPRSGTTLLQEILASEPKTYSCWTEAQFLGHFLRAYWETRQSFADTAQVFFQDLSQLQARTRELVLPPLQALSPKAQTLIFKDHNLSLFLPAYLEVLPRVKCLIMVRDPRDIINSLLRVGKRLEQSQAQFNMFRLDNLPAIVAYVARYYQGLQQALTQKNLPENCAYLRYEDLVQNPTQSLEKIKQATGFQLQNYDPKSPWKHAQHEDNYRAQIWSSDLYGQAITPQRIGQAVQQLPPQALQFIEQQLKPLMLSFAYKPYYD